MSKDFFNKNVALGSLIGGIVGVSAAFLFAPESGKELIHSLFGSVKKKKERIKGKVEEVVDKGKGKIKKSGATFKKRSSSRLKKRHASS